MNWGFNETLLFVFCATLQIYAMIHVFMLEMLDVIERGFWYATQLGDYTLNCKFKPVFIIC